MWPLTTARNVEMIKLVNKFCRIVYCGESQSTSLKWFEAGVSNSEASVLVKRKLNTSTGLQAISLDFLPLSHRMTSLKSLLLPCVFMHVGTN